MLSCMFQTSHSSGPVVRLMALTVGNCVVSVMIFCSYPENVMFIIVCPDLRMELSTVFSVEQQGFLFFFSFFSF